MRNLGTNQYCESKFAQEIVNVWRASLFAEERALRLCGYLGDGIECSQFQLKYKPWHGQVRKLMIQKGKKMRFVFAIMALSSVSGCVTAGYEGQVGTVVSNDQIGDQREANRSVRVFDTAPSGYAPMGSVTVRRCHRNFLEEEPSKAALLTDLKISAYASGGDAISDIKTEQKNGLAANCWYVLEGSAKVWRR